MRKCRMDIECYPIFRVSHRDANALMNSLMISYRFSSLYKQRINTLNANLRRQSSVRVLRRANVHISLPEEQSSHLRIAPVMVPSICRALILDCALTKHGRPDVSISEALRVSIVNLI